MRDGNVVMKSRWMFLTYMCAVVLFASTTVLAGVGEWKNYTSMKDVRAVAAEGEMIWAATSGGVFRFQSSDSTYQKFTNSEGLSTNDVTAIFIDSFGNIWIGQQSGNIDVYSPQTKSFRSITDIAISGKANRRVNGFFQQGDKLYIAIGFGISVFSISKFEFSETYSTFVSANQPNVNAVHVVGSTVFAATSIGVVSSKSGAINLLAPEAWEILSPNTSGNIFSLFNGALHLSTSTGLLKFQSNSWSVTNGIVSAVRIISSLDTALLYVDGNTLRSLNVSGTISTMNSSIPFSVSSGTRASNGNIILGFVSDGVGKIDLGSGAGWQVFLPNGPNSNFFYQMVVDETGSLWVASGRQNGAGFFRFDGKRWTNFHTGNTSLLSTNDCFAISVGPSNSKWVSTYGGGLILVDKNNRVAKAFNKSNAGFIGLNVNTDYIVPGKVAVDRKGNVWTAIYLASDPQKVVWMMKPDSTWVSYPGSPYGSLSNYMFGVVTDGNDTKWFLNTLHSNFTATTTLSYFNESKNITGSFNGWGALTTTDGVTDMQTQSMVVDRTGSLWIGTGKGITIVSDINNPKNRLTKVFLNFIDDQYINCIAIDAQNNKWIGTTTRGIFVISADGRQLINQYTVESTGGKLVDNNIVSLAFDSNNGIMYVGTEKGLSSLEIAGIAAKNTLEKIELSPNPIYLPQHSSVEIRGLVDESTIKVLALNGKVIAQFSAQGVGRAFWNCKDSEGRTVASGIYIIVAHNRAGEQVATEKIAVIRK